VVPTYYDETGDPALRFAALDGNADTDVAIVGGGFAGLGTALSLLERGHAETLLLEADRIGAGASGRNGGFVSGGFSLDAMRLVRQLGRDEARQLYLMSEDAVKLIRARIERYRIDCDAVDAGVVVASWFDEDRTLKTLQRFLRDSFDLHWHWLSRDETRALLNTERYHNALHELDAFHFNPLRYAQGLARTLRAGGVRVHEASRVARIERAGAGWQLHTSTGARVRCRRVVVCCGGYLGRLVPALARASMPIATYVMVTEPLGERLRDAMRTDAAVFDTRFAFDYYRPLADTRLLWGGRMSIRQRAPAEVARLLRGDLQRVYPQLAGVRITHAWSGWMGYSRHEMPLIGQLPDGPWYALGFGGHGVAPTTLGGEVLARALTGEAEVPRGLAHYGLQPLYGQLGRLAAQATYWGLQGRDAVMDWRLRARRAPDGAPAQGA
jgi:gamma-glutamylputrescine oxidase